MTLPFDGYPSQKEGQQHKCQALRIFLPKLILEVFGGAGAIWGCSESIGLRNSANIWFWRPAAIAVGVLFLVRWLIQIRDFTAWKRDERNSGSEETIALVP